MTGPLRLVVLLALSGAAPAASAETLALVGGTVIDGTGGPARAETTVLIEGERIARVGPAAEVSVPDAATSISARSSAGSAIRR